VNLYPHRNASNATYPPPKLQAKFIILGFDESPGGVGLYIRVRVNEAGNIGLDMSRISRFTQRAVTLAKNAVGGRSESAPLLSERRIRPLRL
jgi:hypothetical protein